MRKLFLVNVSKTVVVAGHYIEDAICNTDLELHDVLASFLDVKITVVSEIKQAEELPNGWTTHCVPYGIDEDYTEDEASIAAILKQAKS